jgi:biotin carboxyl carrier protein
MDYDPEAPAASVIWDHDDAILRAALGFYGELERVTGEHEWAAIAALLAGGEAPAGVEPALWPAVQAAHRGFQAGLEILALLPSLAEASGFHDLCVNADLSIHIPERLLDPEHQARMAKVLVPPPVAKADEILAESGGMFYARETPAHPPYVEPGDHFEAGDPLYIVEVMKMFNKVYAPFAGTIDEVLVDADGVIISKGQPLFKVTPDEKIVVESPQERAARRRDATDAFLARLH